MQRGKCYTYFDDLKGGVVMKNLNNVFHYLAGCLRGLQNYGKKKLEKIFKNDRVWKKMTGAEHQKFGKWMKLHQYILN